MESPPAHPVCERENRHSGSEQHFDPQYDGFDWRLLEPKARPLRLPLVEAAFPVFPGQFGDIINHLTPSEVWIRMGYEIRFVWNSASGRETLDFIQPDLMRESPRRIYYRFHTSVAGLDSVHLCDVADDMVVRQRVGDEVFSDSSCRKYPPMLFLTLSEMEPPRGPCVLMSVMRRGFGPYPHYNKHAHTVWVG